MEVSKVRTFAAFSAAGDGIKAAHMQRRRALRVSTPYERRYSWLVILYT